MTTAQPTAHLRIAVVGGPQYDQIDTLLARFTEATGIRIEIAFRGDHPALNRRMAIDLPAGAPLDLISTHSKYAPSQSPWLRPLDVDVSAFERKGIELCSFRGAMYCVPRMVDVRLLWVRRDLAGSRAAPRSWDELLDVAASLEPHHGYAFPGKESGLFGTFFELTVAAGGALFDEAVRPTFATRETREALGWLVDAHRTRRVTPPGLADWHYDEVSSAFRGGSVAMIGDWPGFYQYLDPAAANEVHRYPAGRARRAVYAGLHGYAIPAACSREREALALLEHLTSRESLAFEAELGPIPPRVDVDMPAASDLDRRRADLLRATVAEDMLTFPPLERYPEIEDAGWHALRAALLGELSVDEALQAVQREAETVLA